MDELNTIMSELKCQSQSKVRLDSLDRILNLLDNEEHDRDTIAESLLEQGVLSELCDILEKTSDKAKVAEVIAELAKTEDVRVPCVFEGIVPRLVNLLTLDDITQCTQACRALGNICFDNSAARDAVADNDGVQKLINLLKDVKNLSVAGADHLRMVACGLLLNLTNTHETVEEKALSLGAMDVLKQYLELHACDEGVAQMVLLAVGSLADTGIGKTQLLESSILETIVNLLGRENNDSIQETLLELLTNLAENDQVKLALAKAGVDEQLLALLSKSQHSSEDDRLQTEKAVSDLIVLLLTGDESMEILYGDGRGPVYLESLNWLESTSEQLYVSGTLAVGNFARNDTRCLKLVESGITETLLTLLERHSNVDNYSPTLQHAVFSTLRNLAIPVANKSHMLDCDVINRILPHMHSEFSSVQFKLLGILRLIIDGQETAAKCLGTKEEFIEKLISWCSVECHAGVKGEANRLVAWLIKHSCNRDVMLSIIKHGGIKHLVSMATSEHAVMQNEALVALTLTAMSVLDDASESFIEADIIPTIKVLLTDSSTLPEILCNVLTLVKTLAKSGKLLELMKIAELPKIVTEMQSCDDTMVAEQAKEVAAVLNKG